MHTRSFSGRRDFLRFLGGAAAGPLASVFPGAAWGAGPFTDYRALVCVFLFGGNDSHNVIVPLDGRFATYTANRGPLALPRASLDATAVSDPVQGPFAFHPRLAGTSAAFKSGKLAVVSNVGVLLRPTTKFDFQNRTGLAPQRFSLNDMQGHWHTSLPQLPVKTGWGGRLADVIQAANTGQLPVAVAAANSNVFLKGASTVNHQVQSYSPPNPIVQRLRAYRDYDTAANPQAVFESAITMARSSILEDQYGDIATRALQLNDFVLSTLYSGPDASGRYAERYPINTPFPAKASNQLAAQLRTVAMLIAARQALGVRRQVFFVSLGGFDNHSDQFETSTGNPAPGAGDPAILFGKHADLLTQLDAALKSFYDATVELGVQNNVTTFTASDFGRTLTSNGKGSDHGWGGHHLVMGGAVKGGQIYGTFHNMQVGAGNPADAGQGRLIPDISVDQYAGTMARWMGASVADLNSVFPNLANFNQTDLGFMT
jgi:uncharacterized protein (DUF1501 family)